MNLIRKGELAKKILITDGLPGCGKTMLSPILSSLSRVEMYYFAFEIEFILKMSFFKKIKKDAAVSLIRMLTDYKLYNSMMSREVNFRDLDLSSVTRHHNYKNYIKRLKSSGDKLVPKKIKTEKPILHLTTHDLLNYSKLLISALKDRLTYVELIRHPIDMVNQQRLNMINHFDNPRSIQVEFDYLNKPIPYWAKTWKKSFMQNNNINRAILNIEKMYNFNLINRKKTKLLLDKNFICIPFEKFVLDPAKYIKKVSKALNTSPTKFTKLELIKQNIPREFFFNTPQTKLYKSAGGSLSVVFSRDKDIERKIQLFKKKGASKKSLKIISDLSRHYEKNFLENDQ
tara:strand:+ start:3352 stop:4380 length:1029 start_codon:yes stop_codon:yes gene_type:complete